MKKNNLITIIIILAVIIFALIILTNSSPKIDEKTVKCIGQNSVLYTQLGCHACEIQKEMFGENYQYLTVVDCFYEREKCTGIQYTPTWKINNEEYVKVQSIEKLKELTGC